MSKSGPILILLLLTTTKIILAQEFSISGKISNEQQEPVYFAAIQLQGSNNIFTYSEKDGSFSIQSPKGKVTLHITSLGFKPLERTLQVDKDLEGLEFLLQEESLELDEIVVNAKPIESDEGTSVYKIENQAVKQIQAMSLGDILSLLPGNTISPPNMDKPQQAQLRTAVGSSANSFGTAIIVDGVALSNDANMQAKTPASDFSGGTAVVAGGTDLRSISASGIESVEVLSGVASPKYGNLSSGAIIVKSKVGKSPLFLSTNITPTTYQASLSKGIQLAKQLGILNSDFSYTYSTGSPVEKKTYYHNVNLGWRWRVRLSKPLDWHHTTSFQLYLADDGQRHEPDETYKNEADVKSQNYLLTLNGSVKALGRLRYTLSGNVLNQRSYFESIQTNGPLPMVEALEPGTYFSGFTPATYLQIKDIRGRPVNLNARLEAKQHWGHLRYQLAFTSGFQFVYDKNTGKGRVSSGEVSRVHNSIGSRSARFHQVPASKTSSLYHETALTREGSHATQQLRVGARYDYMLERYHLVSPRLSFSSYHFEKIRFRAAWGISYKAPAMLQLYPGPSYLDYSNMIFFANNPKERLAIVTTYIHRPVNDHLQPSRVNMKEVGIDWSSKGLSVKMTYYHKQLLHGIYHTPELLVLKKQNYRVTARPENQPPKVAPIEGDIDYLLRKVNILKNNYKANTHGVELVLRPRKITATNTEFDLRLSYTQTTEYDNGYRLHISNYTVGDAKARYGVYENPVSTTHLSRGTLTSIQHIPRLRLIFTLATELNFVNYTEKQNGSLFPYAYYDSKGNYHEISEAERGSSSYADLQLPKGTYTIYSKPPFYPNFHLQIRKETQSGHSFSFYANNAFWYNPTYQLNGNRHRLNDSLALGFSMSFQIK
ncbi:TonB-dependent receptor [Rapidithrix thailandica]|uniref:TonB-dependent receptor n=1 Tax=Rapidithrix thailandica TaxID=413964 RepID=A0AAW9RUD9_9BACT